MLNKNSYLEKERGFTLIELLLYASVVAVMFTAISAFFAMTIQLKIKNQAIAEVEQGGVQIMQIITQVIRNGDSVNSPAQGATASSLSLKMAAADLDPIIINIDGGKIYIKEGSSSILPLNSSVIIASDLFFQNLSRADTPGTIRVWFTLSYINTLGKNEYDYTKNFYGSASLR